MRNLVLNKWMVLTLTALLTATAGCGRSADSPLLPQSAAGANPGGTGWGWNYNQLVCPNDIPVSLYTCQSGTARIADRDCYSTTYGFAQRCSMSGGGYIPAAAGRPELCRMTIYSAPVPSASALNPGVPCGGATTGVVVHKGDKLSLTASGGWNYWDGGFFRSCGDWNIFNPSYDVSVSGSGRTYLGMHQGLLGSDGTEVFEIGGGVSDKLINNNGQLHLGFNIPYDSNACGGGLRVTNLRVTHCEDGSGTTYTCP